MAAYMAQAETPLPAKPYIKKQSGRSVSVDGSAFLG
jgi:hypothetical protein